MGSSAFAESRAAYCKAKQRACETWGVIMDFVVYKSEADNTGRLVELVHNKHCEVYEVIVDGIPVFNCDDYSVAEHEYNMERVMKIN